MIRLSVIFLLFIHFPLSAEFYLPDLRGEITVDGKVVSSLQEAEQQIKDGSIIHLGPGTYPNGIHIRHNNVVLSGSAKTHFISAVVEDKAAIITSGENITIKNIECSRMISKWGNGSCIRHQGKNLTVENVYFHDSEEGILEAPNEGRITIKSSRFERLGYRGRAHGIYTSGAELVVENSVFISSESEGHAIKSRSGKTTIKSTLLASGDGYDSRLIDAADGGELTVINSILYQNDNSSNGQLIGFGLEKMSGRRNHQIDIRNNLVIMERRRGSEFIGLPEKANIQIDVSDNVLVGEHIDKQIWLASNIHYKNRDSAGLPDNKLPDINALPKLLDALLQKH